MRAFTSFFPNVNAFVSFQFQLCICPRLSTFLNQIEQDFNIKARAEVQFTHGFDVNAQDAQYHSSLKFELKNGPMPKNNDELQILFDEAVERTNQPKTIQKGFTFIRAYRRDKYGDRNDSLIPQDIMEWYSDDELSSDSDASADLNIETDEE